MDLFNHIRFLLFRHNYVIMPGLGAFMLEKKTASIDYINSILIPPVNKILFNEAMSFDDGLLVSSYARKYKVDYEEAKRILIFDIEKLRISLIKSGKIVIPQLGTLKKNEEGALLFISESSNNRKTGLNEIILKEHADYNSNCSNKISLTVNSERRDFKKFCSAFIKVAAILIILLGSIIAFVSDFNSTYQADIDKASIIPINNILSVIKEESVSDNKNLEGSLEGNVNPIKENIDPKHYLIVATFKSEGEAKKFCELMNEDFEYEIVTNNKLSRVSIASSIDKEHLQQKLNSKEILKSFPSAWIWTAQ